MLLTGDLGFTVVEPFREEFPDRFFNVGVAEQNMVGVATGLAEAGFIPFVYSIVTFASLRAYEFVRNGPIAHQLPVRLVGIGGGFDYGTAGMTHYGLEDLAVMRIQPGITVVVPADEDQAAAALTATSGLSGPIYFRIGKDDGRTVSGLNGAFRLGRAERVREGKDLVLVAAGSLSCNAVAAAEELKEGGIQASVVVVSSLNPPPTQDLAETLVNFPLTVTVEAHYVNGALGSVVAETIAENGLRCHLVRCGVKETPHGLVGSSRYMDEQHGLSDSGVVQVVLKALEKLNVQEKEASLTTI